MRDIIFNKDKTFNGNLDKIKNNCLYINLNKLSDLLTWIKSLLDLSLISDKIKNADLDKSSSSINCIYIDNSGTVDKDIHESEDLEKSDKINLI